MVVPAARLRDAAHGDARRLDVLLAGAVGEGDDADELPAAVDHRQAAHPVAIHVLDGVIEIIVGEAAAHVRGHHLGDPRGAGSDGRPLQGENAREGAVTNDVDETGAVDPDGEGRTSR